MVKDHLRASLVGATANDYAVLPQADVIDLILSRFLELSCLK